MFKIGEFSKLGQVSVRMLRHYDQFGLLKPGHIDKFSSYRYYTAGQPELAFYHNDEYPEADLDVETAVRINAEYLNATLEHPHMKVRNAPNEKRVAALIYEGPYRDVGSAVLVLLNWIGINEWNISGPVRELHLSGPAHVKGEVQKNAVLELQIPITT